MTEPPRGADPQRDASAAGAFAIATASVLAALEVAGLAARDGLFLSEIAATRLPLAMIASAALAIVATGALSGSLRRAHPGRVAPLSLCASGVVFIAIGALVPTAPQLAAVVLYLHMTGLAPVIASSFWSIVAEGFDPYSAKRAVARMAAAAALGGVVGGLAAERIATIFDMSALLVALGLLSALAGWGALRAGSPLSAAPPPSAGGDRPNAQETGLRLLIRRPLLRQMATLMLIVAVVETLVDYAFKVEAAAAFSGDDALVRFFAAFYTGCGLLAFAIQASVGNRFLRRFGLAGAVAMLPASVALAGALATTVAKLWAFVLVRASETVASASFFRTGFQLLYTPVPPAVKRPAKVWVDIASGSLGEMLGAGLVLGLLLAVPSLPSAWVVALAVAGCLLALAIVRRIHLGYVAQLAESLRTGRVALGVDEALDATTARTIAESQMALDRESLLAQARAFGTGDEDRAGAPHGSSAPVTVVDSQAAEQAAAGHPDPTAEWVEELVSREPARARRVLMRDARTSAGATLRRRRRIVSHVIPLLEDDSLAREAEDFLRDLGSHVVGQLVDALLDSEENPRVRIRLAGVLARIRDPRAMAGLWRGLDEGDFELRFACARAAARIVSRSRELAPATAEIYARIARELRVPEEEWVRQGRRTPADRGERSVLLDRAVLRAVSRSLEQIFTLLSLAHEREVMASVLAGLASEQPELRGTALEYLESVLPASLRGDLWPRLHADAQRAVSGRPDAEVAEELLRSSSAVVIRSDALAGDG